MLHKDISNDSMLLIDIIFGFCTGLLLGGKYINVTLFLISTISYVLIMFIFFKMNVKQIFLILIVSIFAFIIGRSLYKKEFHDRDIVKEYDKEIDDFLKKCAW